jgi:hypothetical protein
MSLHCVNKYETFKKARNSRSVWLLDFFRARAIELMFLLLRGTSRIAYTMMSSSVHEDILSILFIGNLLKHGGKRVP